MDFASVASYLHTSAIAAILCRFVLKAHPLVNELKIVRYFVRYSTNDHPYRLTKWKMLVLSQNGGFTRPEDCFLSPFVQRSGEMAYPVPTKAFPQPSPGSHAKSWPSAKTRHPPPPFLLVQNLLSLKDTAGSDTTR